MLSYDMNERGPLSLYEYLYRCIRDDIVSGRLAPDDRLPSRRKLAEHLGVSLITVDGAYSQLVAEGYVVARPRRGYYVAKLSLPKERPAQMARPKALGDRGAHSEREDRALLADFSRPSLRAGAPASALWSKALRQALAQEPQDELYAPPEAQGTRRLRRAIASYLHGARGMDVREENIVVGAGAQLLYGSIALLAGSGSTVALEDPGWPALSRVYRTHGVSVAPVSLDEEGMSIEGLRQSGATLAHIMPSHQFPTGKVTSVSRRYDLLSWAAETGRWIVEDDYDWEFRLAGRPIPSLASVDAAGRVIYVSTFSKSLSSALRIAFMALPDQPLEDWREELGFAAATVPTIDQIALARLLESGDYERHVSRYRTQSRMVRDKLLDALAASGLEGRMEAEEADSGLHFVLAVESERSEEELAARALGKGVKLAPLSRYAAREESLPKDGRARFVMQYDGLEEDRIGEVARVIGWALER
ncbi:MAG: PLP-dependent aminotransferase family protein [Tractidigestivibacter sp.]|jgi:GntR family transcriptional regulator/MocR family aminotransferase|uniref:MocR-like pyridoxine biosynthesis transcription factor PdxR n=1 Tax=Tractidigestivibacter sp. TaxID=2847320 RepID=UPI003D8A0FED